MLYFIKELKLIKIQVKTTENYVCENYCFVGIDQAT